MEERQRYHWKAVLVFKISFTFGPQLELPLVECLPSRLEARGSILFSIAALGKWRQETV